MLAIVDGRDEAIECGEHVFMREGALRSVAGDREPFALPLHLRDAALGAVFGERRVCDPRGRVRRDLFVVVTRVELARVEEGEAVRWISDYGTGRGVKIEADGARELVDALGGDMMMISNELEKLILYVGEKNRITLGDVETMVLAAKQRSLYELTDAISSKDRVRALEVLDAILSSGEGEEASIGHVYMLAKTFRQMLIILERNVRDQRMLWAALWQGFRVPPFAADDIIKQSRRYKNRRELTRAIRLVAKADLALRSNPVSKRMVLERLVIDLTTEPKVETPGWMQEQLPV